MLLGVATHFDQGWPIARIAQVRELGARTIRDDLPWSKGEPQPGRYDFDSESARYIRTACAQGIDVLLMVKPANPGYDGGRTAHTPEAQAAFGRFVGALLDAFGDRCVRGVEIGNEINADGMDLPAGVDRAQTYAGLLAAVHRSVKPAHSGVQILGGSTNVIGTGFLETIFRAGGLADMDGVVVHPYRDHPDGLDLELDRLRAAMQRAGGGKPIWATEFGSQFDDPRAAASFLLRATAMLSAAGVHAAYWYDLVDEPAYRNIGLYDGAVQPKPAGRAMQLMLRDLLQHGAAVRQDMGDPNVFAYRFGADRWLLWGAPRALRVSGTARFFDAEGAPIAAPGQLSEEPIVALGRVQLQLGPAMVLADSLHQYGKAPWSYFARRSTGTLVPLGLIDWDWTSYFGAPELRPLEIRADAAIAAGDGGNPLGAAIRYTAPTDQVALLQACVTKKREGAGLNLTVLQGAKPLYTGLVEDRTLVPAVAVKLRAGETIDTVVAPRGNDGGNAFRYRIRLTAPGAAREGVCA